MGPGPPCWRYYYNPSRYTERRQTKSGWLARSFGVIWSLQLLIAPGVGVETPTKHTHTYTCRSSQTTTPTQSHTHSIYLQVHSYMQPPRKAFPTYTHTHTHTHTHTLQSKETCTHTHWENEEEEKRVERRRRSKEAWLAQRQRTHVATRQRQQSVRYKSKRLVDSLGVVFLSFPLPSNLPLSLCCVWDAHTLTYISKTVMKSGLVRMCVCEGLFLYALCVHAFDVCMWMHAYVIILWFATRSMWQHMVVLPGSRSSLSERGRLIIFKRNCGAWKE